MTPPTVSVLMAVYNGARHLEPSVRSVQAQRFGDFELIAVDDGSTDRTPEILGRLAREDARIQVIRQAHAGQTVAFNRALQAARGRYLARHDADDVSLPQRLERQVAHLDCERSIAVVGTAADVIDAQGAVIGTLTVRQGPEAVTRGLKAVRSTLVHGSVLMRREAVEAVGGYRDAFPVAQDFDLWLRIAERCRLDNVPERLYQWRIHAEGVYAMQRATQLRYGGVALAFARERERYGSDSYDLLRRAHGNLDRFARVYRLRAMLDGIWGELLFRGLGDPLAARPYLRRALAHGWIRPQTVCLFGMSVARLRWPGKAALAATGASR